MKKILFLILIVLTRENISGQCTKQNLPCWYNPSWDWTDNNPLNWRAQIQGATALMGSPFTNFTSTADMQKIINASDWYPSQGWVLLSQDFGCIGLQDVSNATPWFMLYNKYRSIVRLFLYMANSSQYTRASVVLKWGTQQGNNSLLTLSNNQSKTNNQYPLGNNQESFVNYINTVPNTGGWIVTDFQVNFDPNTTSTMGNFQNIDFDFHFYNGSSITLGGDFNLTTQSGSAKEAAPTPNTNPNLVNYITNAKTFLGKAPKRSDLNSGFQTMVSSIDSINNKYANNFTRGLKRVNTSIQNGKLKDYLLDACSLAETFGGVLSVVGTVMEVFVGKANTTAASSQDYYVQPTISKGTMSLSGTILSEYNPKTISLQLPGTSHAFNQTNLNCAGIPVYDCPLGVISVEEAPDILVSTKQEVDSSSNTICQLDYYYLTNDCLNASQLSSSPVFVGYSGTSPIYQQHLGTTNIGTPYFRRYINDPGFSEIRTKKSFKVNGDVKLALNAASGLYIESTKAALMFEIGDYNGSPSFNLTTNYGTGVVNDNFSNGCNMSTMVPFAVNQTGVLPVNTPVYCQTQGINIATSNGPFSTSNSYVSYDQDVHVYNAQKYFSCYKRDNYALRLLNAGRLQFSSKDPNGYHKFQTNFVDISKFKNTAVTLQGEVKVYLKILVTLRPTDPTADKTPVVYILTYEIPSNKFIANTNWVEFPMTCEQRDVENPSVYGPQLSNVYTNNQLSLNTHLRGFNILSGGYLPNNVVSVNPSPLVDMVAENRVTLGYGFSTSLNSGNAKFHAFIQPSTGCQAGTNALVLNGPFFGACTQSALDRQIRPEPASSDTTGIISFNINQIANKTENITSGEVEIYLAPNPNNGDFKLIFNKVIEDGGTLRLINNLGQAVYSVQLENNFSTIDLSLNNLLTKGTYILLWNNNKYISKQKVIIE